MCRKTSSLLWLIVGLFLTPVAPEVSAVNRNNLSRQEIRSLPIEVRPNRAGHFYGNTVRRNLNRRG